MFNVKKLSCMIFGVLSVALTISAQPVAKINLIEGEASVLRQDAADWRQVKVGMPLSVGDQLYTRAESFIEIRYDIGTVLRMNENTKITMVASNDTLIETRNSLGNVWVNMKKITKQKKKTFEMNSPTAVAAIRGTIFQMSTQADSSTDVSVFDGKVAVGPSDELAKKLGGKKAGFAPSTEGEVAGPQEIPGPYEVSLEQWLTIVAGQKVSVRADGKIAQEKIDMQKVGTDVFVKKNQEMDKKLQKE